MIAFSGDVDVEALSERLLAIAQAQSSAIEAEDWAEFDRLCCERDDVQGAINLLPNGSASPQALDRLERALTFDRAAERRIHLASAEAGIAAHQIQHAHSALRGYTVHSNEAVSALLDTER